MKRKCSVSAPPLLSQPFPLSFPLLSAELLLAQPQLRY